MQIKDIKNMSLDELKAHEEWLKAQIKAARQAESAKKKENERALSKRRNHRLIVLGGGLDSILKQANPAIQLADISDEAFAELNKYWLAYLNKYAVAIAELMGKAIKVAQEKEKQNNAEPGEEDAENAVKAEQQNEESVDNSSDQAIPDRTAEEEIRVAPVAAQGTNQQMNPQTRPQAMYPGYVQTQGKGTQQVGGMVANSMSNNQASAMMNITGNSTDTSIPPWMLPTEDQSFLGQRVRGGKQ